MSFHTTIEEQARFYEFLLNNHLIGQVAPVYRTNSDQSYLWDVSVHGLCPGRVQCRERRNADPRASVSHPSQARHSALRPTGETRWQLPYYRPSGFATRNRLIYNDYLLQFLLDYPDPRSGILENSALVLLAFIHPRKLAAIQAMK